VKAAVRILASYSLIAYLEGEEGADKMIEIFKTARDSGRALLLPVVNWGEVYCITLREAGRERAEEVAHLISTLPIQIIPADLELAKEAADKDRGTEPTRPKSDYPWFWCAEEPGTDPTGGKDFVGNRWNEVHLTLARKKEASL
jgi:hypothetical protein